MPKTQPFYIQIRNIMYGSIVMDILQLFGLIVCFIFALLFIHRSHNKRKEMLEMLTQEPEMVSQFKCLECGRKMTVNWSNGDYAMKEVVFPHCNAKKVKCEGKTIISGIYLYVPMCKEEKKYKELCDKWR